MNNILSTSFLAISMALFSGASYASTADEGVVLSRRQNLGHIPDELAIYTPLFPAASYASRADEGAEPSYTLNYMGAPDTCEWIDSYDGVVLSRLQDLGYLPAEIVGKKVLNIELGYEANNCSRILCLEGKDGQSYIVKEMLGQEDSEYKREKLLVESGLLPKVQGVIDAYQAKEEKVLPVLTRYLGLAVIDVNGESIPVSVMTKVKGAPLRNILLRLEDTDLNQDADFISSTVKIAHNIGEQMGQLSRAFFLSDHALLKHADPSDHNFFYDEASGQFSWIDLGGLSLIPYDNSNFVCAYDSEKYMFRKIWSSFFPTASYNMPTTVAEVAEKGLGVLARHRIGILAGEAFYQAYLAQVQDLSYVQSALAGDERFKELCSYENDFFVNYVNSYTFSYTRFFKVAFGSQSREVFDYLFAPHQAEEADAVEETVVVDTPALTEKDFVMGTSWAPIADKIARSAEYKLSKALKEGDFDKAQKIIDAGADITRVFYGGRPEHFDRALSFMKLRLLDMAMIPSDFPKGTIAFLLKNGADVRGAVLDNVLCHYISASDVCLLIKAGIDLGDLSLGLYRAIDHGNIELVDVLLATGAPIKGFVDGHPKIYAAPQDNPAMWNHLIDLGARGHPGVMLSKK